MRGRDVRREQEKNIKERYRKILKYVLDWEDESEKPDVVGRWAHAPASCSDPYCCGNPRRQRGRKNLTKQEKLVILRENEEQN